MICGMSGSLKQQSVFSKAITTVTAKPKQLLSGVKYRLHGLKQGAPKAAPEAVLQGLSPDDEQFKHLSFTFAIIALSAKVACADGKLTQEKYIAFRDSFPLKDGVCGKLRSLFTLACHNETPLEHYVLQIKCAFPDNQPLFTALLDRLFLVASADGAVSREAETILSTIAHILDVSATDFSAACALYETPSSVVDKKQARHIMGVNAGVEARTLKKRYHELMQNYHPDRYAAYDLSPEVKQLLQFKAAEINEAYRALKKLAA